MRYDSLAGFFKKAHDILHPKGPYALVFVEDLVEIDSTLDHCAAIGFKEILVFGSAGLLTSKQPGLHLIESDVHGPDTFATIVNQVIRAFPGIWMHYCFNSEYLYFPFCETRTIGELISFTMEERRDAVLTYVIDLYATDLEAHPNAVSVTGAYLDRAGYYALTRHTRKGAALERQLDFFGGLRWRFEEHIPFSRRRIDRVGLFRAVKGLELLPDHRFNIEEYNTCSCPWHHNITAAICSFRAAKALMSNPGSKYGIERFEWKNSMKFEWSSEQLMALGFMEPGQWF